MRLRPGLQLRCQARSFMKSNQMFNQLLAAHSRIHERDKRIYVEPNLLSKKRKLVKGVLLLCQRLPRPFVRSQLLLVAVSQFGCVFINIEQSALVSRISCLAVDAGSPHPRLEIVLQPLVNCRCGHNVVGGTLICVLRYINEHAKITLQILPSEGKSKDFKVAQPRIMEIKILPNETGDSIPTP